MSAGSTENDARATGHAWVDGNCARCGAGAPRPWAEDCAPATENARHRHCELPCSGACLTGSDIGVGGSSIDDIAYPHPDCERHGHLWKPSGNKWSRDYVAAHPERFQWQARHVESGATVPCRDHDEAEAHVRESVSGPWLAEPVFPPGVADA